MYLGVRFFDVRYIAVLLVVIALLRVFVPTFVFIQRWLLLGTAVLMAVWIWFAKSQYAVKLYPVFVSMGFFMVFAFSLVRPPSIVERIARIRTPELSPPAVVYTRRVTFVWCGFFITNAFVALVTIFSSDEIWLAYNGLISYICMAILFAGEWLVRQRVIDK